MLSVLDLSHHDSREKLDKVLHKLKWNDFPGLQALLLKVSKTVIKGSYRSWKTWKVMEFKNFFFPGLESHGVQLSVLESLGKLEFCLIN